MCDVYCTEMNSRCEELVVTWQHHFTHIRLESESFFIKFCSSESLRSHQNQTVAIAMSCVLSFAVSVIQKYPQVSTAYCFYRLTTYIFIKVCTKKTGRYRQVDHKQVLDYSKESYNTHTHTHRVTSLCSTNDVLRILTLALTCATLWQDDVRKTVNDQYITLTSKTPGQRPKKDVL